MGSQIMNTYTFNFCRTDTSASSKRKRDPHSAILTFKDRAWRGSGAVQTPQELFDRFNFVVIAGIPQQAATK